MPDVLSNLQKLPVCCVVQVNGQNVVIERGVMGYTPTTFPQAAYETFPVSPAQRQAMLSGCQFGWDKESADVDFYDTTTNSGEEIKQKKFVFIIPFMLGVTVGGEAQALAEKEANKIAKKLEKEIQSLIKGGNIIAFSIDDDIQLIEEVTL